MWADLYSNFGRQRNLMYCYKKSKLPMDLVMSSEASYAFHVIAKRADT